MNTQAIINHIVKWLKDYAEQSQQNGFVVGVSGGIDSAVTSTLCAKTGLRVLCLEMPIHQDPNQVSRAEKHINNLKHQFANVSSLKIDLTETFDTFQSTIPQTPDTDQKALSLANTRARFRMSTLYYFAGLHGYLVAGTGNKVEDFGVGFYTKYGDGGVDLSPIADLMKSEVYALGRELNIIDEILNATPTDGLFSDSRSDEDQLGASYDELEWAMTADDKDLTDLNPKQQQVLKIYKKLNQANQHKMQSIPVCKIPPELK
ncbi:NAD(+) synthase [Flavobacterium sp. CS20]|jgi:NAD+ synthase|uniref:NAD(+) synthase n=1 Tax=Flavobacterium sp. CS20 TaxID=2775246 RepID=UPI001B39E972|nr:NAD(+) synthase [Flavobacterium sp. CS20]QTY26215.1 NAD(+) synthase [Flavobacterium sp. CS20]